MTLRKQEKLMIEYLIKKRTWVSSNELSSFLNVSIRTLRSRIKEINQDHRIIMSSHQGYKIINEQEAKNILNDHPSSDEEYSVKGRRNKIIKKLIQANEGISIYDLADELYVSDSTIQQDILYIKRLMSAYHIDLMMTNEKVSVKSNHRSNYLKVMSSIVYQEANEGFMSLDVLCDMFPQYQVLTLRKIIVEELAKNDLLTNDYSLISIILHFCIGFDLADKFKYSRHGTKDFNKIKDRATINIIHRINETYDFTIDENCIGSFYEIIYLYTKTNDIEDDTKKWLYNQEVYNFVCHLAESFYEEHFVDIQNEVFISGLTLHLEQLLAHPQRQLKNPLHAAIRNGSPIIYELAVIAANAIHEKWSYLKLSEHEISYIAIHIGLAFEKKNIEKINVALVNLNYHHSSKIIAKKIKDLFHTEIHQIDIYSDESEVIEKDVDLVITTVQTKRHFQNNVLISMFVTQEDEDKLHQAINQVMENKISRKKEWIYDIFHYQYFYYFDDKQEDIDKVISQLCEPLIHEGIEMKNFEEKVMARERVSSTSYLNIAIPHSFDTLSKKTTISIGLMKHPIKWGSNWVNIVFLLSISKEDQKSFIKILEKLIKVFTGENWNKNYKRIDNYDKLMTFIRDNEY